jgi:hypothetical protein
MASKGGDKGATGGGGRKNLNAVEVNAQWVEFINKEMANHHLNEHFDFNPKNCKKTLIIINVY